MRIGKALAALAIAMLLPGLQPLAADERTLVEGKTINGSGYSFEIPGIGKAKLSRVTVEGKRSDDCRVVLESVIREVQEGARKGTLERSPLPGSSKGVIITVSLLPVISKDDEGNNVIYCADLGTGCELKVEVPDPPAALAL